MKCVSETGHGFTGVSCSGLNRVLLRVRTDSGAGHCHVSVRHQSVCVKAVWISETFSRTVRYELGAEHTLCPWWDAAAVYFLLSPSFQAHWESPPPRCRELLLLDVVMVCSNDKQWGLQSEGAQDCRGDNVQADEQMEGQHLGFRFGRNYIINKTDCRERSASETDTEMVCSYPRLFVIILISAVSRLTSPQHQILHQCSPTLFLKSQFPESNHNHVHLNISLVPSSQN